MHGGKSLGKQREKAAVTSPGKGPWKEPILPKPWSWTSSLQNYEETNLCPVSLLRLWYFLMAALAK